MPPDQSSAADSKLEVADEVDEAALASVMRTVPLGAAVLFRFSRIPAPCGTIRSGDLQATARLPHRKPRQSTDDRYREGFG